MEELRNMKKAIVQRGLKSLLLQGKKSAVGQKEVDMKRIKKPISKSAATLAEQGLLVGEPLA